MAFALDSFNALGGQLGAGLFSLLPGVATARGLQAAAAASASAQRAKAATPYDPNGLEGKARLAEQRADNYARLSAKLERTVAAVTDARDTLVELKEILSDMRKQIVLAQSDTIDDTQRRQHADTFDQLLGQLNSKVRFAGGLGGNIIGNEIRDVFSPEGVTYKTKPDSPVTQTVSGIFSGSDYVIADGSGNVFFADIYGSVLQQFPFDDTVDSELIAEEDTVVYDADTGAISITHAGEATPFIAGTLERKGLGVLHSYLYGDFTDEALLDEALADLDAASAKLRFNIAVIEGDLTKVTAHRDFNANLVGEHRALATKVESQAAAESATAALEAERQQLLFASTLQGTLSFDASGTLLSLGLSNLFDVSA